MLKVSHDVGVEALDQNVELADLCGEHFRHIESPRGCVAKPTMAEAGRANNPVSGGC